MTTCEVERCKRKVIDNSMFSGYGRFCEKHYKWFKLNSDLENIKKILIINGDAINTYRIFYYREVWNEFFEIDLGLTKDFRFWSWRRHIFMDNFYHNLDYLVRALGNYLFHNEKHFKYDYLH